MNAPTQVPSEENAFAKRRLALVTLWLVMLGSQLALRDWLTASACLACVVANFEVWMWATGRASHV